MPHVKQISVHTKPQNNIAYILNGDKNADMKYATGINTETDVNSAYELFKLSFETNTGLPFYLAEKDTSKKKERVRIHHYIQSFDPKEKNITPELVHKIGVEWAKKCFGEDRYILVSTHVDKEHIHNHFAISPYDFDGNVWLSNQKNLAVVRKVSDKICLGYNLSVIKDPKGKGDYGTYYKDETIKSANNNENKINRSANSLTHKEWEAINAGTSWKEKIRNSIDKLISDNGVNSVEDIKSRLKNDGYEIKREGKSKEYGSYFSIKPPKEKNAVRNYSLGEDYTYANLEYRIKNRITSKQSSPTEVIHYKGIQEEYVYCIQVVQTAVNENIAYYKKKYSIVDVQQLEEVLNFLTDNNITASNEFETKLTELSDSYDKLTDELYNIQEKITKLENSIEHYDIYKTLSAKIPTDSFANQNVFTPDELKALKKTEYTYAFTEDDILKCKNQIDILRANFSETQAKTNDVRQQKEKTESVFQKYQSHINFDYQSIFAEFRANELERKHKAETYSTEQSEKTERHEMQPIEYKRKIEERE